MAEIDVDRLRDYLEDYFGTAAFNGFPLAMADAAQVEDMDGLELCRTAEELGVDLERFEVKGASM